MSSSEWPGAGLVCLECDNLNSIERDYCERCGVKLRAAQTYPPDQTPPPDQAIAYSLTPDEVANLRHWLAQLPDDRDWFVGATRWPTQEDGLVRVALPAGTARLADLERPHAVEPWQALTRLAESIDVLHDAGLRLNGLSFATIIVAEDGQVLGPCLPPCLTEIDTPATNVPLLGIISGFAAPEVRQYTLHDPGRRSDVFSLAAVYAYLATGRPPCDMSAHEFDAAQLLQSLGSATREVLTRALALDPNRRALSASALVADLAAAAASDQLRSNFEISTCGVSDIGLGGRDVNEDAFATHVIARGDRFGTRRHGIAVVADGMGGAEAGELASQFAVDEVTQTFHAPPGWLFTASESVVLERVRAWLLDRNERLFALGESLGVGRHFGTTLSAAALLGTRVLLMHLGDSRVYRFRAGRLEQLTEDQSLAQQYLDAGRLTAEQAETSEYRSVLVSHLGSDHCRPHVAWLDAAPGDVLFLATDGLLEGLDDRDLLEVLGSFANEDMCGELLCRAKSNLAGQPSSEFESERRSSRSDNMTAVVVSLATRTEYVPRGQSRPAAVAEHVDQADVADVYEHLAQGVSHESADGADGIPSQPAAGGVGHGRAESPCQADAQGP